MAFARENGLPPLDEARQVSETFGAEMAAYCELVLEPGGVPAGLMFRGEGASFSERVQTLLAAWEMPERGIGYHRALAEAFGHRRAFLKLEWQHAVQGEGIDHLASFYFRRRPSVGRVVELLSDQGVQDHVLTGIGRFADLLNKGSVHFVSAALRPGQAIRFKLYFSQYVTPERHLVVLGHLLEAAAWAEVNPETRALVAEQQRLLVPRERVTTIFVSIAFDVQAFIPSIKVDYPGIRPEVAIRLLPPPEQEEARAEMDALCRTAGRRDLSFLGVRLYQAGPLSLKYYADLPAG